MMQLVVLPIYRDNKHLLVSAAVVVVVDIALLSKSERVFCNISICCDIVQIEYGP